LKNGLSVPLKLKPHTILDLALKWQWGLKMLQTHRRTFRNIVGHAKDVGDLSSLHSWTAEQFDPRLDWNTVMDYRKKWDGKFILKGILDEEDAKKALNIGADAIIVSNHGGRQLDGALSSIAMLPRIMEAVGDKIEVHLDSGIRSGQDVLKALALGATGTYIGRAFVYGLGAMGEQGVSEALRVIHTELDTTMALCGEQDVRNLGRHNLLIPPRKWLVTPISAGATKNPEKPMTAARAIAAVRAFGGTRRPTSASPSGPMTETPSPTVPNPR